jgi:RNA polymerase sigma-70 factor (ECF subfamily)
VTPEDSFAALMRGLRRGEPDAAAEVLRRFAGRLIALARARLDGRLRQKVDPEDMLQSVCRTFFRRHAEGQLAFGGWDDLWGLLTVITLRKCGRWREHFQTEGRDAGREVPADSGLALLDREPDPAEAVQLTDEVEALLRGLTERDRAVVALRLEGCTPAETARQLGVPECTVFRVLDRVKRRQRDEAMPSD